MEFLFTSNGGKKTSEYQDSEDEKISQVVQKISQEFDPFSNLFSWNQGKKHSASSNVNVEKFIVKSTEEGNYHESVNQSVEIRLSNDGTRINIGDSYTDPKSPGRSVVEDPFGNIIDPFGDILSIINGTDVSNVEKKMTTIKTSQTTGVVPKDTSFLMPDLTGSFLDVHVDTTKLSIDQSSDDNFGEFQDAVTSNHEDPKDSESDEFGEFQEPDEQSDLDAFREFQDGKDLTTKVGRDSFHTSSDNLDTYVFEMPDHAQKSSKSEYFDDGQSQNSAICEVYESGQITPADHLIDGVLCITGEKNDGDIVHTCPDDENTTFHVFQKDEKLSIVSSRHIGSEEEEEEARCKLMVDESFSEELSILEGFEIAIPITNDVGEVPTDEKPMNSTLSTKSSPLNDYIRSKSESILPNFVASTPAPEATDIISRDDDNDVCIKVEVGHNYNSEPIIHPSASGGIAAAAKRSASASTSVPEATDTMSRDDDDNECTKVEIGNNYNCEPIIHPFAGGGIATAAAVKRSVSATTSTSVPEATDTMSRTDDDDKVRAAHFEAVTLISDVGIDPLVETITVSKEHYVDPIILAASKGSQVWTSVKGLDGLPLVLEGVNPRFYVESCNTSLSSATRRDAMSPSNSMISFQTNESNARKSLVPSQLCINNLDLSPGSLFSPGQSDSKVYSKSSRNGYTQAIIDHSILSPLLIKWSPTRSKHDLDVGGSDEIVSEKNNAFDLSEFSSENSVDYRDMSQNSKMLVACSSFTQHDFTPQKSDQLKVSTSNSKSLRTFASVTWTQMVSYWKHSELSRVMLARALSHHFTKPQRCTISKFSTHFGISHPSNLSGFLQDALDWEKNLSIESNNTNGFCPSKFTSDPSLIKFSLFLSSLGPLPFCTQSCHIWTSKIDISHVIKHEIKAEMNDNNIHTLLQEAERNLPLFKELVHEITTFSRRSPSSTDTLLYKVDLKTVDATVSKARYKYGGEILFVKDVLRSRIILQDEAEMVCALVYIYRLQSANFFTVLRMKNLFRTSYFGRLVPTDLPTGYRHILVNIRLQTGLIAEIQLNLKQMYDVLGDTGYKLHSDLMRLNYMRQTRYTKAPFKHLCSYTLCPCSEKSGQDDSVHNLLDLISTYLDVPLKLPFTGERKSLSNNGNHSENIIKVEPISSNVSDFFEPTDDVLLVNDETENLSSLQNELNSENNSAFDAEEKRNLTWNDIRKEVKDVSQLDLIDLLLEAACNSIDENPNDTALYNCIHEIYSRRYRLSRSTVDHDNAVKALETSLEITDHANLVGMTGWLGYGKSNVLDRVLERPYFTLFNLAAFYAMNKDWKTSVSVLRSLLLRCEQHLPLYHPITIVTLLDLSAGLSMVDNHKSGQNYRKRARSRLTLYLREQQEACLHIHAMHRCAESEPFEYYKLVGLDHFSMLTSFCGYMRSLLRRKILRAIPEDHPIAVLNAVFVADSLLVLANCFKNSDINAFNKEQHQKLFAIAAEDFRNILNRSVLSKGSFHPSTISISCGLANCLVGLDKTTEALHLLSSIISPSLQQLNRSSNMTRNSEMLASNEPYDIDNNIIAKKMDLSLRESIAFAMRLFANLHLKVMPSTEGRVSATGLLRKALEIISEVRDESETKFSKSLRRLLKKEIKELVEQNQNESTKIGRHSNSLFTHPFTSAFV